MNLFGAGYFLNEPINKDNPLIQNTKRILIHIATNTDECYLE